MADLHVQVSTVKDAPEDWRESEDVFWFSPEYGAWFCAKYADGGWRIASGYELRSGVTLALFPSPDQAAPDRYAEALKGARACCKKLSAHPGDITVAVQELLFILFPELEEAQDA